MAVAPNKPRLWTMAEAMIGKEQWAAKSGTLAGSLLINPNDIRRVVEVLGSDVRDVLVLAPDSLFILQPKSTRKLGLVAGLRAAAGSASAMGQIHTITRSDVREIVVEKTIPIRMQSTDGRLQTIRIHVRSDDEVVFLVDTSVIPMGGFQANAAAWIGGT